MKNQNAEKNSFTNSWKERPQLKQRPISKPGIIEFPQIKLNQRVSLILMLALNRSKAAFQMKLFFRKESMQLVLSYLMRLTSGPMLICLLNFSGNGKQLC